ncbi:MAG: TonB-dependent siderophore receptor [Thiobacillus sp.]|nr:TonB-dependent siderophore receptor [Thiobacillus sp.]
MHWSIRGIVLASWLLPAWVYGAAEAECREETVVVTAGRLSPLSGMFGEPVPPDELPATQALVTSREISQRQPERAETLLQQLAGVTPSVSNAGLSTALHARGFDMAGQVQYNGHPDIQRLFVRDLATVEGAEVLKGHLSVLYGQGAPGATINYLGKRPNGSGNKKLAFSIDSEGARRVEADLDGAGSPESSLSWRLVAAAQAGDTWINNVSLDRQTLFGTVNWHLSGDGVLRFEAEHQHNERPFSFGTVYVNGRFKYDKSYVAPVADSDRRYGRYGLYLEQPVGLDWRLDALWSASLVRRDETLAGFWSIEDEQTLSGYYRELADVADQTDARLALRRDMTSGDWLHHLQAGWQRTSLDIDFTGPQNIGGFDIDIDNPDFSGVDFAALPMSPRISRERQRENGLFLFDRIEAGPRLHLMAGLRRAGLNIATDNGTVKKQATDVEHTATNWGGLFKVAEDRAVYLSRSESFQPNRGLDRFGGFLSPRTGRQYELGWHAGGADYFHAALFDIRQDNLTAPDPLDKTALTAVGSIRSRGIELDFREKLTQAWTLSGQLVVQQVRYEKKTYPAYGDQLAGVPEHYGALSLAWRSGRDFDVWATLARVGPRWGDAYNSFRAPGYTRLDMGARYTLGKTADLRLNVRNLGDKRYVEYLSDADNVYQGERRNITLTVQHAF